YCSLPSALRLVNLVFDGRRVGFDTCFGIRVTQRLLNSVAERHFSGSCEGEKIRFYLVSAPRYSDGVNKAWLTEPVKAVNRYVITLQQLKKARKTKRIFRYTDPDGHQNRVGPAIANPWCLSWLCGD